MSRILITGGAGFIGSSLAEVLLQRGDEVIVFDNFDTFYTPTIKHKNITKALLSAKYKIHEVDIRDYDKMMSLLEGVQIDKIFHGAARAGVRPSIEQPMLYEDVNIKGTLNMLELARHKKVEKMVFASSSSVYGNNKKVPFSETDNVDRPISPYAATKKAAEEQCYTYHHLYDIPITCLRFFTVYGPRQRPEMAIHKFTRLIDSGEELPVFGDGTMKRNFTYIDDIISGVVAAIDTDLSFEIINLGGTETISVSELISMIEAGFGKTAVVKYYPESPGDVQVTYADITKAEKLLTYKPHTKIADGIKKFINWYNQSIIH